MSQRGGDLATPVANRTRLPTPRPTSVIPDDTKLGSHAQFSAIRLSKMFPAEAKPAAANRCAQQLGVNHDTYFAP